MIDFNEIYNEIAKIIQRDFVEPALKESLSFQYKVAKLQNTNSYVVFKQRGFVLKKPDISALDIPPWTDEFTFDINRVILKLPLIESKQKSVFYRSYQSSNHSPQITEDIYDAVFDNYMAAVRTSERIKEKDLVLKAFQDNAYELH